MIVTVIVDALAVVKRANAATTNMPNLTIPPEGILLRAVPWKVILYLHLVCMASRVTENKTK